MRLIRRLLLAFQFLTVVPVRVGGDVTEKDVAGSAVFFPLVGAFQGLLTAVPAFLITRVWPADIAAGLAMVCLILSNNGFDLDGLADTFDGLAVKSSGHAEKDREKRLAVMRDSATGAMGVIALIVIILLKFILMRRLLSDFSVLCASALFFLMPAFSKWITVPAMLHGVSARRDGLGKAFVEHTGPADAAVSTLMLLLLFVPMALVGLIGPSPLNSFEMGIFLLFAGYLFSLLAVRFLKRMFGGLTGDHLGALTELFEVFFLLAAYGWLRRS
jgi:adenosylcobinamide-GDP ribazoletransferase